MNRWLLKLVLLTSEDCSIYWLILPLAMLIVGCILIFQFTPTYESLTIWQGIGACLIGSSLVGGFLVLIHAK